MKNETVESIQKNPRAGGLPNYLSKSLRVFVANSSGDKHLAGALKYFLGAFFGLEVFIAHEDIVPSTEWEVRIREELESTDVLLALVSKNFKGSDWTSQEVGIALALNKHIIPIKLNVNPFGFLYKIQALDFPKNLNPKAVTFNSQTISDWVYFCKKIISAISTKERFKSRVRSSIIKAFKNSSSFKTSEVVSGLIRELRNLTKEEVNEILTSYIANNQLNDERYTIPYFIDQLINKYSAVIEPSLLSEVKLYRKAVGPPKQDTK